MSIYNGSLRNSPVVPSMAASSMILPPSPLSLAGYRPQPLTPTHFPCPVSPILPVDGVLELCVNIRYRGHDTLILAQSIRVEVSVLSSVQEVWRSAMRREPETLRAYDDRLTGKALAVDRFRDVTLNVWMSDPVTAVIGDVALDTFAFTAEPSAFKKLIESAVTGLKRLADRVVDREPGYGYAYGYGYRYGHRRRTYGGRRRSRGYSRRYRYHRSLYL